MAEQRRTRSRLSLIAVQSIVCGVILLLALLLRLIGGDTWDQLRTVFQHWMTDDGLAALVEPEPEAAGGRDIPVGEAVSVLVPPEGATFAPISLPTTGVAPLHSGEVTSVFGYRTDPIRGGTGFHTGTDVSAQEGEALYAPYDGTVTAAAWDNSYGYYVTVRAGDVDILYAHCSVLLCREGDDVKAGDTVARVGSTGDSTGNHVHIELHRAGICYDPAPLIPETWYA